MNSSLIDTLFLSEKRKDLLLFLKEGGKSPDEIKKAFDYPWKSMIPQIKKLAEWDLITYANGNYTLTSMGEIITENMENFLKTLKVHENYRKYWLEHDLAPVPKELLLRIGEIENCTILEPQLPNIYVQHEELIERMKGAERIMAFISVYNPAFFLIYRNFVESGTNMDIIFTQEVMDVMMSDISPKSCAFNNDNSILTELKEKYIHEMKHLFDNSGASTFVYRGEEKPLSMIVTDRILSLSLMNTEGKYDNSIITSSHPSAISWGEELFEYYRRKSVKLNRKDEMKRKNE